MASTVGAIWSSSVSVVGAWSLGFLSVGCLVAKGTGGCRLASSSSLTLVGESVFSKKGDTSPSIAMKATKAAIERRPRENVCGRGASIALLAKRN